MKTAEMGVLIKFPSKQRQDRHLPVVFRSGDVQDKNLKISLHLHSSPLSVLGMLFKTLLLHTAPPLRLPQPISSKKTTGICLLKTSGLP